MEFVAFMRSWAGRLIRIAAGALLMWYGMTQMIGRPVCWWQLSGSCRWPPECSTSV